MAAGVVGDMCLHVPPTREVVEVEGEKSKEPAYTELVVDLGAREALWPMITVINVVQVSKIKYSILYTQNCS